MNNELQHQVTTMYENLIRVDYHYLNLYYCIGEGYPTDTAIFEESQHRVVLIREGIRRALIGLETVISGEVEPQDIRNHISGLDHSLTPLFDEFRRVVLSGEEHNVKESVDKFKEIYDQVTSR